MSSEATIYPALIADQLDSARKLLQSGRLDDAEQAYSTVLKSAPFQPEAIDFLAMRSLGRGQVAQGIRMLETVLAQEQNETNLYRSLGICYMSAGRLDEAIEAFMKALKLAPGNFVARLFLGNVLERLGHGYGALTNYFGAIASAQMMGQWQDQAALPPLLREPVQHAMAYVVRERRALFATLLDRLEPRYGKGSLDRVRQGLAGYLLDIVPAYPDARQKPTFFYVPGLPATPYFSKDLFPWIPALESRTAGLREEVQAVMAGGQPLEPFHKGHSAMQKEGYLKGTRGAPAWDTLFFFRHGIAHDGNLARCPRTAEALAGVPLAQIREHAPETLFSILRPGTHILPHRGVTNTRVVGHLPLVVPGDCALVVGGEIHEWQEGRTVVFDDTFEHEAWNRSDRSRAILLMDLWNPHLTDAERGAVADLVAAIGDFNTNCGLNAPLS